MTIRRTNTACLGFAMLCLLSGCAGGLLGGGKPDVLYRFGASGGADATGLTSIAQRTLLFERVRFAPEIDGDRILAVHEGSARYIKGSRWVTSAPSLFAQAMVRSFHSRAPGFRITTTQSGEVTGYSLVVGIDRFEAQYDDAGMAHRPAIAVEGDATLYGLSDRKIVAQRHFVTRVAAEQNRVEDIIVAFDHATKCYTADVADWVTSSAAGQTPAGLSVCAATP